MTKKTKTFRFYAQMQKPNIILSENFKLHENEANPEATAFK